MYEKDVIIDILEKENNDLKEQIANYKDIINALTDTIMMQNNLLHRFFREKI